MTSLKRLLAGSIAIAALAAACSSAAATPTAPTATPTAVAATPTAPPASGAPTAVAATPTAPPASGAPATVMAKAIGGKTVLVAGSNGMTVYTYTADTANSGTSACTGACLTRWPALTVAAGTVPTAGDGVTGKLDTIKRADNGALQVTYKGLPLYFFQGDAAPGDTNGSYTNWNLVTP